MSAIAASADGSQVAVLRDAELSLYAVEPFAVIVRATVPGPVASGAEVTFVGRHVLVHGIVGERTHLTLFGVPRLLMISQLELESPTRLLAASHGHALLGREADAFVATCTSTSASVAPLRLPIAITRAVGLEQAQFLTWSPRGAEIWDAASRRPVARVALELPRDVAAVGVTGQLRSLWASTTRPDLLVSRLSDGRTIKVTLPGIPGRIASHPATSWLVVEIDGAPHVVNTALRSCAPIELPAAAALALVPIAGADTEAYVIIDEGTRLSRHAIGPVAVPGQRRGLSLSVEPLEAAPEPAPVPRPIARPARTTPAATPAPAPGPAPVARDWRELLGSWARGGPADPLPDAPPIARIAERAGLGVAANRILHRLYAEWLAGHGDVGVAVATLAAVGGAPDGWAEALGTGRLAALGLLASDHGRTVLLRTVGAFLDGRDAGAIERIGIDDPGATPDGLYRVAVAGAGAETERACAARVAAALGQVGFCDDGARIGAARLEAWLHERALIVAGGVPAISPFDLRPGETVLVIAPPGSHDDDGPPFWRDAAS